MKKILSLLITTAISTGLWAQTKPATGTTAADSLMNAMNKGEAKGEPVIATFKSTRLILGSTTETVKKNNLNFLVIHRFGDLAGSQGGGKTFFGLDNSSDIYIGFEYGISNNLDVEFGRSKFAQQIDLGLKYAVLHQTSDNSSPIAITLLGKAGVKAYTDDVAFQTFGDRFAYVGQAIIARKFSSAFSLQVSPTFVRHNSVFPYVAGNEKDMFALGVAGRLKITKRLGIVVDYAHPFSSFRSNATGADAFYDPLGVGLEIETGGHVFTIVFSNAKAITESNYLSNTQSDWGKGQFRLGFTISRMFSFSPKEKKNDKY
jgi:hypothetical protein